MISDSHIHRLYNHKDTLGENNLLTLGLEVIGAEDYRGVCVILNAEQISLHHPLIIYGSKPFLFVSGDLDLLFSHILEGMLSRLLVRFGCNRQGALNVGIIEKQRDL